MNNINKTSIRNITWDEARKKVKPLNPILSSIIDEIKPSIPIKELKYPYGMTIADDKYLYLPDGKGGIVESDVNKFPYFINIDKNLESFLITSEKYVPDLIYLKGDIFPKTMDIYDFEIKDFTYKPNSPFTMMSGIRNLIITSLFSKTDGYLNLQQKFDIPKNISPTDAVMHFEIVKSITEKIKIDWRSTLYMLDLDWVYNIFNNDKWWKLREYLYRQALSTNMQRSNTQYVDYALTEILTANNISIKPYTLECIKQILSIVTGSVTGFRVATDDSGMPLLDIMNIIDEYCKPLTMPVIAEASSVKDINNGLIYLSIEATKNELSDKKTLRPMFYLNEIIKYIDIIFNGLSTHDLAKESIYSMLNKILELKFFSEKAKSGINRDIKPASDLILYDKNINRIYSSYKEYMNHKKSDLSFDRNMGIKSAFTKGLISIETNGVKS